MSEPRQQRIELKRFKQTNFWIGYWVFSIGVCLTYFTADYYITSSDAPALLLFMWVGLSIPLAIAVRAYAIEKCDLVIDDTGVEYELWRKHFGVGFVPWEAIHDAQYVRRRGTSAIKIILADTSFRESLGLSKTYVFLNGYTMEINCAALKGKMADMMAALREGIAEQGAR
ncbi:MAG: hypothetical protein AAGI11_18275 [Pseudomonadota bacterium]